MEKSKVMDESYIESSMQPCFGAYSRDTREARSCFHCDDRRLCEKATMTYEQERRTT